VALATTMVVMMATTVARRTTNGREDFWICILIAFILFGFLLFGFASFKCTHAVKATLLFQMY
jgi:MFS superfamily sulfate permease-like transporter